eukprot:5235187-Amphidinium_carterae.2
MSIRKGASQSHIKVSTHMSKAKQALNTGSTAIWGQANYYVAATIQGKHTAKCHVNAIVMHCGEVMASYVGYNQGVVMLHGGNKITQKHANVTLKYKRANATIPKAQYDNG